MMDRPSAPQNCPKGLEYLTQLDQLLVKQKIELFEGKRLAIHVKFLFYRAKVNETAIIHVNVTGKGLYERT